MMSMTITEGKGEYHDEYKYCKKLWIGALRIEMHGSIHNVSYTTSLRPQLTSMVSEFEIYLFFISLVKGFVVRQTHAHSSARKVPLE